MRIFEDENYYEILQVPPHAGPGEIRRAYREALATYEESSVVTYSLFSDHQRADLLRTIETAFATLSDDTQRTDYNQMLIDTGQVEAATFSKSAQRMLASNPAADGVSKEKSLSQWIGNKTAEPEIKQLIQEINADAQLSGRHLNQLRKAYGIEISEIYVVTKISSDTLKMIEGDRFQELPAGIYLKQFLRTYAEILHLDPNHVVESYMKQMAMDKKGA